MNPQKRNLVIVGVLGVMIGFGYGMMLLTQSASANVPFSKALLALCSAMAGLGVPLALWAITEQTHVEILHRLFGSTRAVALKMLRRRFVDISINCKYKNMAKIPLNPDSTRLYWLSIEELLLEMNELGVTEQEAEKLFSASGSIDPCAFNEYFRMIASSASPTNLAKVAMMTNSPWSKPFLTFILNSPADAAVAS